MLLDAQEAFRLAIEESLGHSPAHIEPGKIMRFSTSDRRGDKAGWCIFFDDGRAGVFGDYRRGCTETWVANDRQAMTRAERAELDRRIAQAKAEREASQQQQWTANAERIARIWNECRPLTPGDSATLYLKRRGMAGLWPLPQCLRMHRALEYWEDGQCIGKFPAMVAPLVGTDGRTLALHRTWLTADGRKANVSQPRKLTGAAGFLSGAAIPLHKPVRGTLGIAEGIETALAAWAGSGVPVVAAYSAGNLAAWRWPSDVSRVIVFGDNDEAGRAAAFELRNRATAAGLRCEILTPTTEGEDWCDVWAARQPIMVGEAA